MKNSKELWLAIDKKITSETVQLGRYASEEYVNDPIHLSIVAARYKFCARMMKGLDHVLEVGCGDGFGSAIVASAVNHLICTDINKSLLDDSRERLTHARNVSFEYFDFRTDVYPRRINGIFLIDVIEHIYREEEQHIMAHLVQSLSQYGIMIIGTPNKSAEHYSSPCSKEAHINLKDHNGLLDLAKSYFNNVFLFGMNDEVLHTGFPQMAHYLWALCASPIV